MSLHNLLGWHVADLKTSHWENGYFVSRCTICGQPMVKLPGEAWQLRRTPH